MAIISLKNVEVTSVNAKGNGLKVLESNEHDGRTYTTRYTIWFKEPSGLSVGDRVNLSGLLGAKVGDPWQGREGQEMRSVELSLNSPRIGDVGQSGSQEPSTPQSAPKEPSDPYTDSESPF